MGWITRLTDPVYRKSKTIGEKIAVQIPTLSEKLEPYTTPEGKPSLRQFPLLNAFLPTKLTQESEEGLRLYQNAREIRRIKKEANLEKLDLEEQAQNLYEDWKELPKDEANGRARELKEQNPKLYNELEDIVKDAKQGLTYEERMIKSMGVENGTRTQFIWDELKKLKTREEKNQKVREWREKKVISDNVFKQLQELKKKEEGINLENFVE